MSHIFSKIITNLKRVGTGLGEFIFDKEFESDES
jgi:hypothetical protein